METPLSDEYQLVSLLKEGDRQSFETLYRHYGSRLTGYLIKMTKSEYLAAEILQETFLKIWNGRDRIDPSRSFRSYLFKIASNLVYDFFRKVSSDAKLQSALIERATDTTVQTLEESLSAEDIRQLHHAIRELPSKRRRIFELVKIEEHSYAEVSSILNVSTSTINDHIVKATKALREKLHPYRVARSVMIIWYLLGLQ